LRPSQFPKSNINADHWDRQPGKAASTLGGGGNAPSSVGGIFAALLTPAVSLCSASRSPGTDEQPAAERRHPVLVDQWSGASAVVQVREMHHPQTGSLNLGLAKRGSIGLELAGSKPPPPPDAWR